MAEINIQNLKTAFENGDVPNETDFSNLIDSSHNSLAHTNVTIRDFMIKANDVHLTVQTTSADWLSVGTGDISALDTRVTALESIDHSAITTLGTRVTSLESYDLTKISTLDTRLTTLESNPPVGSLNELSDVNVSGAGHTPSDGQALIYDAAMGHWMPKTVSVEADQVSLAAISESIIPDQNQVYDLGSSELKFRHLYLSGNTIYLGDQTISYDVADGLKLGNQKLGVVIGPDIDYEVLKNRPSLFDGDYNKLTNRPSIPKDVDDLTDLTGRFAASGNFSGSYADLTNKPNIPQDIRDLSDVSNKLNKSVSFNDLTDKPVIPTGFDDLVGTINYNTLTNKPTIPTDINQLSDADGKLNINVDSIRAIGINAVTNMTGVAPGTQPGDMLFDRSSDLLKVWNGFAWVNIQGGSGSGGGAGGISITTTEEGVEVSNAGVTIVGAAGVMVSFDQVLALGRTIASVLYIDGDSTLNIFFPVDYIGTDLQVVTTTKTWDVQFPQIGDNIYLYNDGYAAPDDTDGDGINDDVDSHIYNPTKSGVDTDGDSIDDAVDPDIGADNSGSVNEIQLISVVDDELVNGGNVTLQALAGSKVRFTQEEIADGTNTFCFIDIDGESVIILNYPIEYIGKRLVVEYQGNTWATTFGEDEETINLLSSTVDTLPQISLVSPGSVSAPYLGSWSDPGAIVSDDTLNSNDYVTTYGTNGNVDTSAPGQYTIIYTTLPDAVGQTASVTRTVTITNQPPVLSLVGAATINLDYKSGEYSEPGITLVDEADGLNINTTINYTDTTGADQGVVQSVDTNSAGVYTITYSVTDDRGLSTSVSRTVNVVNSTPVITLVGANPLPLLTGTSYIEPGFQVTDETKTISDVVVSSDVNTAVDGVYTVTYNLTDELGLTATQRTRTVIVGNQVPVVTLNGSADITMDYKGAAYNDPGVTVTDETLTVNDVVITIEYEPQFGTGSQTVQSVDVNNSGVYTITYSVGPDEKGQSNTKNRVVRVLNNAPTMSLINNTAAYNDVPYGGGAYNDPGVTVTDETVTAADVVKTYTRNGVSITGPITTNLDGNYTITYTIQDDENDPVSLVRNVTVTNIAPTISLNSPGVNSVGYLSTWTDPGASVVDEIVGNDDIVVDDPVDVSVPGTYTVTYTITDDLGLTASVNRTVNVFNTAPTITLQGGNSSLAYKGTYTEPSPAVTVTDEDVDSVIITRTVSRDGVNIGDAPIDTSVPGTYVITYTATDDQSAQDTVTRTVIVNSNKVPTITMNGGNASLSYRGTPYTEPSPAVTVTDETATVNDVTRSVTRDGISIGDVPVDVNTAGTYVITYTIADDEGQTASVSRTVTVTNVAPTITLNGGNTSIPYKGTYTEPSPAVTVTDENMAAIVTTRSVTRNGSNIGDVAVDTNVPGTYVITYTATDDLGLFNSVTRTVTVNANQTPTITLLGTNNTTIAYKGTYTEPSPAVTVTDETATVNDVTRNVTRNGTSIGDVAVDTNTAGTYVVTYSVTDDDNQTASVSRTVTVNNNTPVINLLGASSTNVVYNGTYTEPSPAVTVTDETATVNDVTRSVTRDGVNIGDVAVDTNVPGTYVITYTVADDDNQTASVSRTVTVEEASGGANQSVGDGELATIYQTTTNEEIVVNNVTWAADEYNTDLPIKIEFTAIVSGITGNSPGSMFIDYNFDGPYYGILAYDPAYEGESFTFIDHLGVSHTLTFEDAGFIELT